MPGFYGIASVISSLNKHLRTGKVVTNGTLNLKHGPLKGTTVSYANTYVWPQDHITGAGGQGRTYQGGRITIWAMGESTQRPEPDDTYTTTIEGESLEVRINDVQPRINADQALGYAIFDLEVRTT